MHAHIAPPLAAHAPARESGQGKRRGAITAIAIFKLVKGTILLLMALGALRLFHQETRDILRSWLMALHFEPGRKYIGWLVGQLTHLDKRHLGELGLISFLYAVVFLTEGTGLLLRKRWAEYLTVIATGSLIPFELYELVRGFSVPRLLALVVNAAVVIYLVARLRSERSAGADRPGA